MKAFVHTMKMKIRQLLRRTPCHDRTNVELIGSGNESFRNEWIMNRLLRLPTGIRLLDAGSGEQPYKKYCTHLNYVSQDFAQYNPEELNAGLQMKDWDYGKLDIISDVTSIPEPDASFDAILCTEVIEHIVDPIDAIKEFSRLLKSGGQLILSAPFCSMTHFAPYHFYSGFNRFFYQSVLPQHGFKIVEMHENGNYFEYMAQELKRLASIGDKYAATQQDDRVKQSTYQLLEYLQECSARDKGSKELLCFGFHVLATKKEHH